MKTALRKALPLLLCLIICICLAPASNAEDTLTVSDADVFDADIVSINTSTFPDSVFRSYVLNSLDQDGSHTLSSNEISRVGYLNLSNKGISNLKGIEYFTNLSKLYCQQNSLQALDVSRLTNLEVLYAWGNQLTQIDVTHNRNLSTLALSMNKIARLDLSGNPNLQYLFVNNNQLTEIDVSGLPYLIDFNCSSNALTELDVSHNAYLVFLSCESNSLSSLKLNHRYLGRLYCAFNPLAAVNISRCPELLDVVRYGSRTEAVTQYGYRHVTYTGSKTEMTEDGSFPYCVHYSPDAELITTPGILIDAYTFPDDCFRDYILASCDTNRDGDLSTGEIDAARVMNIAALGISDLTGIGSFTALQTLICANNQLTSLDLSTNTALKVLDCSGNRLTGLDLHANPDIENVKAHNNSLSFLNISRCTRLQGLTCEHNALTGLDISECPLLIELTEIKQPQTGGGVIGYGGEGGTALRYLFFDASTALFKAPDFILPASLAEIETEAFAGGSFAYIVIPDHVSVIGSRAFADCPNLRFVKVLSRTVDIAPDAFAGTAGLTIRDSSGSIIGP